MYAAKKLPVAAVHDDRGNPLDNEVCRVVPLAEPIPVPMGAAHVRRNMTMRLLFSAALDGLHVSAIPDAAEPIPFGDIFVLSAASFMLS